MSLLYGFRHYYEFILFQDYRKNKR